jgi:hypothetical protein
MEGQPGPRAAATTMKLTGDSESLQLTFIGQVGPDELLLRVVALRTDDEEVLLRNRLAVTSREAEVLLWPNFRTALQNIMVEQGNRGLASI